MPKLCLFAKFVSNHLNLKCWFIHLYVSANCNEAIMLITDGAPYYFDEIFGDLNNMNISEGRGRTRVFTYLVGREVTDTNEVLWMACKNKGTALSFYKFILNLVTCTSTELIIKAGNNFLNKVLCFP